MVKQKQNRDFFSNSNQETKELVDRERTKSLEIDRSLLTILDEETFFRIILKDCISSSSLSNPKTPRSLQFGEKIRPRPVWDDLSLHREGHGHWICMQIDPKTQAFIQGGLQRWLEGNSNNAPFVRISSCCEDQRDLWRQCVCSFGYGIMCRWRAFR